jgi:outer membrane receptor protein involved in Fe transport
MNRWFFPALLLPILFVSGWAQSPGLFSLSGVVSDQNDALVSDATLTLKGGQPSRQFTIKTDAGGAFRFEKIAPGEYEITAMREGFSRTTITVSVGARSLTGIKLVLPIAEVQQEIVVTSSTAQPNTDADGSLNVVTLDRTALDQLPSLDQDYIATLSQFLDNGAVGSGGATLIVDGMEAVKAGVSPSAIQEVKINNNPYSAEYSRPGRGRIEVVTKPGSAQFHGAFNFLFRNQFFNARDVFATTRPDESRRIFEGNLTGPLGSSKTHPTSFLISANREEEDLQAIVFASGPSGPIRLNYPQPARDNEISLRLTRQMTEKSTLSLLYSYEYETTKNLGVGGFNLPETAADLKNREDLIRISHNWLISSKLVNQIHFLVGRYDRPTISLQNAPRVIVQDAFTGGGAQGDYLRTEAHWTLNQSLTYSSGKHTIKAGVQIPDFSRRGFNDRTNAQGTFYFSSLQDYLGNRPYSFIQQQGLTKLTFWEIVAGGFLQDEIRLRPNLTVALGLRYDWQNYFNEDSNNFAPRLSVAWSPGSDRKTVIRSGLGLFYDRTGPIPISEALRFDGQRLRRLVITNPGYPDPLGGNLNPAAEPSSVVRWAPNVRIPYTLQAGVGVERQLQRSLTLTVNYNYLRGVDLFRSRDINAPIALLSSDRPDPNYSLIRQIESTGRMSGHSLELGLRGNISRYFTGMVQYILGRSWNDTSGIAAFPANSYDLRSEWSRSDFDVRNRFNLLGVFKAGKYFNLGASLNLNSGSPYSITTGRDDNRDSLALDRPAGVARNTLQGPGFAQLDLRWSREFNLQKRKGDKGATLTLGVNALNVTNRVNYAGYVGNLSSPFFGQAVAARPSRRMQFTLKLAF